MSARNRAFTLIEMTVVITVLALMAALIMPNMVAIKRSQELRVLEAAVRRLPSEAREESRRRNAPVSLRVDGQSLVMEQIATGEDAGSDPKEIKRVTLSDDLRVEEARQGSETMDLASWKWTNYPDGSANAGSVTFQAGTATKTLRLPARGEAEWTTGAEATPSPTEENWPAGDIEHHG